MRAPYQTLSIPYRKKDGVIYYCVLHRSDCDMWQFIAGGGEEGEVPEVTSKREIFEEGGLTVDSVTQLRSMAYIPTTIFPHIKEYRWPSNTYVVPEYAFAFECKDEITISHEHTEYVWLPFDEAYAKLYWDSNRAALYELDCTLREFDINK